MKRQDIRILIVDRNPHVREYLQREFLKLGYGVAVARTCSEVQQKADSGQPPHLVVMDPELPGQNGYSFLEDFKAHHPEIPLILHLFAIEDSVPKALRGTMTLVEKSGNIEDLKRSVEQVLFRRYPALNSSGTRLSDVG